MSRRARLTAEGEAREAAEGRSRRIRGFAFALVALIVLGVGVYLAAGVFLGPRGSTNVAAAIPMRISMAGFSPAVIHAKPGEAVTLDWWNTDGAMHLQGGVHTLVSDTLGLRLELPAQSRKTVTIMAPTGPGDYDFWCDSCCGGKDSPTMHGILRVES
jgi:cytochrome c oxidase subunit 2